MWRNKDIDFKRNILYMYFEERLTYIYGKGFGTVKLAPAIKLMNQLSDPKIKHVEMPGVEPGSENTP